MSGTSIPSSGSSQVQCCRYQKEVLISLVVLTAVTLVALGVLTLLSQNIPYLSALGTPGGWSLLGTGSLLLVAIGGYTAYKRCSLRRESVPDKFAMKDLFKSDEDFSNVPIFEGEGSMSSSIMRGVHPEMKDESNEPTPVLRLKLLRLGTKEKSELQIYQKNGMWVQETTPGEELKQLPSFLVDHKLTPDARTGQDVQEKDFKVIKALLKGTPMRDNHGQLWKLLRPNT